MNIRSFGTYKRPTRNKLLRALRGAAAWGHLAGGLLRGLLRAAKWAPGVLGRAQLGGRRPRRGGVGRVERVEEVWFEGWEVWGSSGDFPGWCSGVLAGILTTHKAWDCTPG